jgi:D-sedoheptulose 7-phosphate isomerase
VAIGISTSGRSPNVLEALKVAKQMDLQTIALCGKSTGELRQLAIDVILSIPSEDTPVIQELHLFLLHMLAEMLEKNLFAGDK